MHVIEINKKQVTAEYPKYEIDILNNALSMTLNKFKLNLNRFEWTQEEAENLSKIIREICNNVGNDKIITHTFSKR